MDKEFLYVGHYIDEEGNYILKPGTTNNLERRRKEHNRSYARTPNCPMSEDCEFEYDWYIPLSKYNTLRYEDETKRLLKELGIGEYMRNDRFNCGQNKPEKIEITIRKTYTIQL